MGQNDRRVLSSFINNEQHDIQIIIQICLVFSVNWPPS